MNVPDKCKTAGITKRLNGDRIKMNLIQKKALDFKQNKEQLAWIGELGFIGYYGIMVLIKTFGYVSYETFFKVAFVLALAGLAVKVLTTRYTMREFLILYLLLAVSAVCWLRVGEKNVMFITLTLWGMKNVSFRDLMRATLWIRGLGTALMISLSATGILNAQPQTDMATDYSEFTVYAFGYIKSNAAFYMIFVLIVLFLYIYYDNLKLWHFVLSVAVCCAGFGATYCRTGMIVFAGMWALIILDKLSKNKKYYKWFSWNVVALFVVSFLATIIYQKANPILFKINRIFNGRIEITNNYYKAYGITLFPKTADIFWNMNYTTMDNFYMYLFISCGVLVALGFVIIATRAQQKLYRDGHYREILFFFVFAVYAMLEQSPFNPILNPFILLMGNLVYRDFKISGNYSVSS